MPETTEGRPLASIEEISMRLGHAVIDFTKDVCDFGSHRIPEAIEFCVKVFDGTTGSNPNMLTVGFNRLADFLPFAESIIDGVPRIAFAMHLRVNMADPDTIILSIDPTLPSAEATRQAESLYAIGQRLMALEDALDTLVEAEAESSAIESIDAMLADAGTSLNVKIDRYAAVIRRMETEAGFRKSEATRLNALAKLGEGAAKRLRERLAVWMLSTERTHISTGMNEIRVQRNGAASLKVHCEASQLPDELVTRRVEASLSETFAEVIRRRPQCSVVIALVDPDGEQSTNYYEESATVGLTVNESAIRARLKAEGSTRLTTTVRDGEHENELVLAELVIGHHIRGI